METKCRSRLKRILDTQHPPCSQYLSKRASAFSIESLISKKFYSESANSEFVYNSLSPTGSPSKNLNSDDLYENGAGSITSPKRPKYSYNTPCNESIQAQEMVPDSKWCKKEYEHSRSKEFKRNRSSEELSYVSQIDGLDQSEALDRSNRKSYMSADHINAETGNYSKESIFRKDVLSGIYGEFEKEIQHRKQEYNSHILPPSFSVSGTSRSGTLDASKEIPVSSIPISLNPNTLILREINCSPDQTLAKRMENSDKESMDEDRISYAKFNVKGSVSPVSMEHGSIDDGSGSDFRPSTRSSTGSPSDLQSMLRSQGTPVPSPLSSGPITSLPSSPESPRSIPSRKGNVTYRLDPNDLWQKFHELGTEMIITKTGRRMFPTLRMSFSGSVDWDARYAVALDIIPVDRKRYRYAYHRSSWVVACKADPQQPSRLYIHPDSPFSGQQLMQQSVSFEKLKLTNNPVDKNGHIVLNSMHKYQPRIHLIRLSNDRTSPAEIERLEDTEHETFVCPETVFIAVTAYQNQLITKLKIDSNPFAKGFRDSSRPGLEYERESLQFQDLAMNPALLSATFGSPADSSSLHYYRSMLENHHLQLSRPTLMHHKDSRILDSATQLTTFPGLSEASPKDLQSSLPFSIPVPFSTALLNSVRKPYSDHFSIHSALSAAAALASTNRQIGASQNHLSGLDALAPSLLQTKYRTDGLYSGNTHLDRYQSFYNAT